MILCDECVCCDNRKCIEEETDKAKTFLDKYGASYVFKCGAIYNRKFMNSSKYYGSEVIPSNKCRKVKTG